MKNKVHVEIVNIAAKRINIGDTGFYILCVPDDKLFYDFWIMHDKHAAALHMFGETKAKAENDETLLYIASEGWKAYRDEYINMI